MMRWVLACVLALVGWTSTVRADTIAASLFEEGVSLLKEKKFEEACQKLDASFKREALSGTLMVLAQCHQLRGMTATAWDEYQRASVLAAKEGRKEYEEKAKELAAKIEPELCRLQVTVSPEMPGEGLVVTLAGQALDAKRLGTSIPLDPGTYVIAASAPDRTPWSSTVTLANPGETVPVTIPVLARNTPEPVVLPTPLPVPVTPQPSPQPAPEPEQPAAEGGVPTWAWITGALGVVMAGVAVGFLVDDLDAISDLRDSCEPDPNGGDNEYLCDAGYDAEADNVRKNRSGALALVFGIGAAAALTASIIGIVTSPGDRAVEARIDVVPLAGPGMGGLSVSGRF